MVVLLWRNISKNGVYQQWLASLLNSSHTISFYKHMWSKQKNVNEFALVSLGSKK